ncbi:carbohydrate ABC transporter permease [Deinococcus oregonensis]|uniref:Carbohydrate ABC transporter permease n=1 Tax=Deinococcus oregonensis TaxID=1805970 RepID=A0ABV6B4Y2_9DEIO
MLAPALIFFAIFILYPLFNTVRFSFYEYSLTSANKVFVGLANYFDLGRDSVFWVSLRNNLIILVGSVTLQVSVGLILAAILQRGLSRRWSSAAQVIIFAPMVMSSVAVGLLWQLVLNPSIGLLDTLLRALHLPSPMLGWLGDPQLAIFSVLLVACWQFTGFMMVILLAGMQGVPPELYEAGRLDGANEVQMLAFITIPVIRNVVIAAVLITMIGAFKVFDLVYVLTSGGPANASEVLATYLYKNAFNLDRMGYANAIAVILLMLSMMLGVVQLRFNAAQARSAQDKAKA